MLQLNAQSFEVVQDVDEALVMRAARHRLHGVADAMERLRHAAVVDLVENFQEPLLDRVGQALAVEAGMIVVVAHMDDLFARTARHPTPEALTAARAGAVVRILESHLPAGRLSSLGLGAREPLVPNRDAASRAENRRIDIRLYPQ